MKFEEHCQECIEKLGNPFEEVHIWLDEFAGSKRYGMKHRKARHHLKGIEEVRKLFGEDAVEAAKLHILSDMAMGVLEEYQKMNESMILLGYFN